MKHKRNIIVIAVLSVCINIKLIASQEIASYSAETGQYSFVEGSSLYISDNAGNVIKVLSSESRDIIGQKINRQGNRIAAKLRNPGIILTKWTATYTAEKLVVVDVDKDSIMVEIDMDQLLDYSWSPDGKNLVFIKGILNRSKRPDYFIDGKEVYLYDTANGDIKKLIDGGDERSFWSVKWLPLDGRLYFTVIGMKEYNFFINAQYYDFNNGNLIPTRAKSADLSPDGKFCIETYGEDQIGSLSDATTGQELNLILGSEAKQNYFIDQITYLFDWIIQDNKTYAIVINNDKWYKVDCTTGKVDAIKAPYREVPG